MTHDERKALREKHYSSESFECCTPECMADDCLSNYPCDVIKVLDYLDVVDPMPSVFPTPYSLDVPPESAGNPVTDELPWAYRDWSYEVEKSNNQEPPHEINWAGGK